MARKSVDALSDDRALFIVGLLIDASGTRRRAAGIDRALLWADQLEARGLSPVDLARLDYFRGNAWDCRRRHHHPKRNAESWSWDQPELLHEVYFLRRARRGEGFDQLEDYERCQIHTNLGSQLSRTGRTVEALEHWNAALRVDPSFWMARGNRGSGLSTHARALYDPDQVGAFLLNAHDDLSRAITDADSHPEQGHPEALAYFRECRAFIETHVNIAQIRTDLADEEPAAIKGAASASARSYRAWCGNNGLVLNPLNDIDPKAVRDDLAGC